ncbi:MAG: YggS family pyridoxal phosphate-dependent enzyme [Treponemataceae bacterium]|nr:MAG: YggS family pyridoxal phosphate-dependent enzyme [Treponemataceae bacterium]
MLILMATTQISTNLAHIRERIQAAEEKAGRKALSVQLLAVSKFHPKEAVEAAIECGQKLFGENYVQEAAPKFAALQQAGHDIEFHFIGKLQRNKVHEAVRFSSTIQSVDRIELLCEIEKECAKLNKNINVFFEYATSDEDTKSGFTEKAKLWSALEACAEMKYVFAKGFMTMAPFTTDKNAIRKSFRTLREIQEEAKSKFPSLHLTELSMGMTNDFEIAIEEGSTLVRIGTAIFGERKRI